MILQGDSIREYIEQLKRLRSKMSITALGAQTVPNYIASWHHNTKALALQDVIRYSRYRGTRGGISRLLISEPPQHGKSLHAELAAAMALGQDPSMTVMATSYSTGLAGERAENTKRIMKSPGFLAAYPTRVGAHLDPTTGRVLAAKDQSTYFKTLREHPDGSLTDAGGYFYAAGITAGLTGRGYRLGIIDDWIKDEQSAYSAAAALHRIGTYTKGFETRQQGVAGVIAIGTLWDNPDWLDWLFDLWIAQGHDPVWLRFPALSDDTARYPLHADDPRKEGSDLSLWPERFPDDEQRKKRAGLLMADPQSWYALQQQNPKKITGSLFTDNLWKWFATTGPDAFDLRRLEAIHLSVDGNVKETGSSFAVIGVYGVLNRYGEPHYFRLDESRGHYEFSEFRDETLRLWNKWKTAYPNLVASGRVWVEDKANGPALMSQLAGHGIAFTAVPKGRSKVSCYRMAQLPLAAGQCWLPSDSNGLVTSDWVGGELGFVRELSRQPSSPDDRADEFSQMIICNDPSLGIDLLRI